MAVLINNLYRDYKICAKCRVSKLVAEFGVRRGIDKRDGKYYETLEPRCNPCRNAIQRERYGKSPNSRRVYEQTTAVQAYRKEYKHRPHRIERTRALAQRPEKKAARAKRVRERRAADPRFRLDGRITCQIYSALRSRKAGRKWETLVGYTIDELVQHLESLFRDGMTWENSEQWEVDHIIPKSNFKYLSEADEAFKDCWSLANLQPLWKSDNRRKNNRIGWNGQLFPTFKKKKAANGNS